MVGGESGVQTHLPKYYIAHVAHRLSTSVTIIVVRYTLTVVLNKNHVQCIIFLQNKNAIIPQVIIIIYVNESI